MFQKRLRITAWAIVTPVVCLSGTMLHAEAIPPTTGAPLWSLIATPMLTGAIGIVAAYIAIRFDARKSVNQELIKKRISVYDSVAPKLNELLCFFLSRGSWKSLNPPLIIQRKRELDQTIYIYGPLFSPSIFEQYNIFIHTCFKTFVAVGRDACLRADRNRLKIEWGSEWKPEWDSCFVAPAEAAKSEDVMQEYNKLLAQLATEIGARRQPVYTKTAKAKWRRWVRA